LISPSHHGIPAERRIQEERPPNSIGGFSFVR